MSLTDMVIMPGTDYQATCDAIREKTGTTDFIKSGDMASAIAGIETGGGFPNGTEWTQSNITSGFFAHVYYEDGIWITSKYYSVDGKTWVAHNLTKTIYKVCKANGLFVAATSSGLYYSSDGKTWTVSNITSGNVRDVCYSGTMWVAARSSSSSYVCYSTDGKTWTNASSGSKGAYTVRYADGVWLAGSAGYSAGLYYSTNGTSWTASNISTNYINDIYYGNGMWVALRSGAGIWYSDNGSTWTQSNITTGTYNLVRYFDGVWIAVGEVGALYSDDGKTWNQSNLIDTIGTNTVYKANGLFILSTYYGVLHKSFDGKNWEQIGSLPSQLYSIHNDNGIWVGGSSNNGLYYSVTWEPSE